MLIVSSQADRRGRTALSRVTAPALGVDGGDGVFLGLLKLLGG